MAALCRGAATGEGSGGAGVKVGVTLRIALEDVLEEGGALLHVKRFVVGARQAGVEHVFDGELELGACRSLLPPVQDQQLLEPVQQVAGDFLYLAALFGDQLRRRAGEDDEDGPTVAAHDRSRQAGSLGFHRSSKTAR
jgi:hypothetical protein